MKWGYDLPEVQTDDVSERVGLLSVNFISFIGIIFTRVMGVRSRLLAVVGLQP